MKVTDNDKVIKINDSNIDDNKISYKIKVNEDENSKEGVETEAQYGADKIVTEEHDQSNEVENIECLNQINNEAENDDSKDQEKMKNEEPVLNDELMSEDTILKTGVEDVAKDDTDENAVEESNNLIENITEMDIPIHVKGINEIAEETNNSSLIKVVDNPNGEIENISNTPISISDNSLSELVTENKDIDDNTIENTPKEQIEKILDTKTNECGDTEGSDNTLVVIQSANEALGVTDDTSTKLSDKNTLESNISSEGDLVKDDLVHNTAEVKTDSNENATDEKIKAKDNNGIVIDVQVYSKTTEKAEDQKVVEESRDKVISDSNSLNEVVTNDEKGSDLPSSPKKVVTFSEVDSKLQPSETFDDLRDQKNDNITGGMMSDLL